MSQGAFRDASAAIERAMMLEKENEELRAELVELAELRVKAEEVDKLRAEVDQLRAIARGENEGAYLTRLGEERDELTKEVRELRDRLAQQERDLALLAGKLNRANNIAPFGALADRIARLLGTKKDGDR